MPLSNATHRVTDEAAVKGLMLHELDFLKTALLAVGEQPGA
jgi:hypothetical protein